MPISRAAFMKLPLVFSFGIGAALTGCAATEADDSNSTEQAATTSTACTPFEGTYEISSDPAECTEWAPFTDGPRLFQIFNMPADYDLTGVTSIGVMSTVNGIPSGNTSEPETNTRSPSFE